MAVTSGVSVTLTSLLAMVMAAWSALIIGSVSWTSLTWGIGFLQWLMALDPFISEQNEAIGQLGEDQQQQQLLLGTVHIVRSEHRTLREQAKGMVVDVEPAGVTGNADVLRSPLAPTHADIVSRLPQIASVPRWPAALEARADQPGQAFVLDQPVGVLLGEVRLGHELL